MSISRRGFLGSLAAGARALAGGEAHAGGGAAKHFSGHPGSRGLLHDTTLCVGCRSCEVACAEVNGHPAPEKPVGDMTVFEQDRRITPTSYTVVNRHDVGGGEVVFRKHQCMHCNEPCCASVCLVRAFTKTPEGPVLYDPDVCMGCRYCVTACPYYALSYEYDNPTSPTVRRCTMCHDRIKQGKDPGCSEACPTGAITFGRRDELLKVARERIRKHPERYLDHIFGEHEFGGTSWLTLAGVAPGKLGLHEGATHTSLPEIGTGFLSVVPLVITIYPGLLAGFYAFSRRKERLSEEKARAMVVEALMKADDETRKKLDAAAKKAKKDQERSIGFAVKRALKEAEEKWKNEQEEAGSAAEGADEEESK